jgi:hypothetical protein
MEIAHQVWNRACHDWRLKNRAPGDRALAAVLLAHGCVMNGGVLHAVEECLDQAQLDAAMSGYTYFGLAAVAEILSRAKHALATRKVESVELERYNVGEITVILSEEDDSLDGLEPLLHDEYRMHVPDDTALFDRLKLFLAKNKDDFATV